MGLPYVSQLQTLRMDTGDPTIQGKRKSISAIDAIVNETRPPETETETPPSDTTKTPEPPKQPEKVKKPADFLREKLSKTEQERDTFKSELEKLKTSAPTEDPEKKSLAEKLQATEARLKQMDDEMRFVNYEKSTEYKDHYEKPYHDAWQSGRNWISRLKANGDDGNPRQATAQDFDAMAQMAMQDPDAAANALEAMFGPTKAATIATHITKVLDAGRTMTEALEHYRKEGGVRAQQSQEQQAKLHQELESVWKSAIDPKTVPDKFKPWVLPKGADDQGNPLDQDGDELLTRGLAEFDKAQSEDARDPRLTLDQRKAIINRAAAIRNKAANFPRLVRWIEQRDAKIAELEKALKGYQKSEPGAGEERTDAKTPVGPNGTMDSVFANLDKKAQARFY